MPGRRFVNGMGGEQLPGTNAEPSDKTALFARPICVEAVNDDPLSPVDDHADAPATRDQRLRGLFRAISEGRLSALDEVYEVAAAKLYGLALWRTGSQDDAADVVQEVFVRVAEQGARLRRVENPSGWLLAVTHRAAVDVTRRRQRRRESPIESCTFLEAKERDADNAVDAERASRMVAGLPAEQRDVIYLRHYEWLTFAEIGDIVGVPKFTAASRYRSGIAKLRKALGDPS